MNKLRQTAPALLLVLAAMIAAGPGAERAHAVKQTFTFMPPKTPTDKPQSNAETDGWGALVIMFTGNVTAAQFAIENSPCPNFMDVPGFAGPTDTITIVPAGPGGYKIPTAHKFSVMVTSDAAVSVKNGAGSPPTPTFWRYKNNNASAQNVAASPLPEPASLALLAAGAPLLHLARRRIALRD